MLTCDPRYFALILGVQRGPEPPQVESEKGTFGTQPPAGMPALTPPQVT